jgi:hypothetical protein
VYSASIFCFEAGCGDCAEGALPAKPDTASEQAIAKRRTRLRH